MTSSPRTRVRRMPNYQIEDRDTLNAILDAAIIAHVGIAREGLPVVLPFACARSGDDLLLHGSTGSGVFGLAEGQEVCVEVTHVDGLVFARSLFESSIHYRSAVIFGVPQRLQGDEAYAALDALSEHLMPGRTRELRGHTRKELAATLVLRLPLNEWSVKVGRSDAHDPDDGESRDVWAGVLPFGVSAAAPSTSPDVPDSVPVPASVAAAAVRFSSSG